MHELNIDEVVEVSGGHKLQLAYEVGYLIGDGVNWLLARSYSGRGQFPSVPRAGRE